MSLNAKVEGVKYIPLIFVHLGENLRCCKYDKLFGAKNVGTFI